MRLLFINVSLRPYSKEKLFPIGLGYIAASLLEEGHGVFVLDIEGHRYSPEKTLGIIKRTQCDAIGIGTLITWCKYVKWLVKK